MTNSNAITQGLHHAGFTVPDIDATGAFLLEALGFEQVGEIAEYPARFYSDGTVMITLWQVKDRSRTVAFDRHHNVGMHHVAFRVADLDGLYQILSSRADVDVEFAPEPLGSGGARHAMCTIPGGLRVEFIQP